MKLGDGYTQIAYNPDDVENVRLVIDYYKKKLRETPKDIDIDEYMAMAGPDGRDYLEELAVKGYEGMMHVEQLEEIQNRINDKDYLPISINIESLLLREEKDAYIFRVPRERTREASSRAIRVKKEDCILLDEGQTVITCLARKEDVFGYVLDNRENPDFSEPVKLDVKELEKAFAPVGEERVELIGKLKPEYAGIFPSFNQGQENEEPSFAPNSVAEKSMEKVLSMEAMKENYQSTEYIPVTFDMDTQMVAESKKRSESSEITEYSLDGKALRTYAKKNEEIATECLKHQRSRGSRVAVKELENTITKDVLKPKGKKH